MVSIIGGTMFKQIYRFLSILIISNLFFSPAVLSNPQNNSKNSDISAKISQNKIKHKKTIKEIIFGCKKPVNQESANNQTPTIKKPTRNDQGYVTKYGVYYRDDIYNTYPQSDNK